MNDDRNAPATVPEIDPLLEVLADHRRRAVLRYLRGVRGEVEIATLAEGVRTADGDPPRDRIALRLHHVHLPKLASAGLVDYDRERRCVAFADHGPAERLLDALADCEPGDRDAA